MFISKSSTATIRYNKKNSQKLVTKLKIYFQIYLKKIIKSDILLCKLSITHGFNNAKNMLKKV